MARRIVEKSVLPFLRSGFSEAVLTPVDFGILRRSVQPQYLRNLPPTPRQPFTGGHPMGTDAIIMPLADGRKVTVFTWREWDAPS